jgi:hypothetical protein
MSDRTLAVLATQAQLVTNAKDTLPQADDAEEDEKAGEGPRAGSGKGKNTSQADGKTAPSKTPEQDPKPTDNNLTPEQREDIQFARNFRLQEKGRLIESITANSANTFLATELNAMPLPQLQKLAALAAPTTNVQRQVNVPLFLGANSPAPVVNSTFKEGEDLDMAPPVINYAEEAKLRK